VLTNPKYVGANIYNRRSFKLKHKRVHNPAQMWIWKEDAFEPIVEAAVFEQARTTIEVRHQHLSDEDLLERLKNLLRTRGKLSGLLIDEMDDMPSSSCYRLSRKRLQLPHKVFKAAAVKHIGRDTQDFATKSFETLSRSIYLVLRS
jgi:hypothetical protein